MSQEMWELNFRRIAERFLRINSDDDCCAERQLHAAGACAAQCVKRAVEAGVLEFDATSFSWPVPSARILDDQTEEWYANWLLVYKGEEWATDWRLRAIRHAQVCQDLAVQAASTCTTTG